jgi:hypothetical protein
MSDKKSITQLNVTIPEGHIASVKTTINKSVPYYFNFGNGMYNKRIAMETIDAVEQFETFTPQEWFVFKLLKEDVLQLDDNNKYISSCIVQIDPTKLDAQERNKFTIGYKRLSSKSLVKRIKRGGHYMINPGLLIPKNYSTEIIKWNNLIKDNK